MEVNQKELGAILGVTARRIRQLRDEYGLFQRGLTEGKKSRTYCLEKCVPEYINYKLEAEVQQGTNVVKEREQAEHERIKKKISILKLRRLKRELHEADDVEEFLTDMLIRFKNRLISIPQKVSPLVLAESDVNKIIAILEKEIFEALDELSEYDPVRIDKESEAVIMSALTDEEDEEEEDE